MAFIPLSYVTSAEHHGNSRKVYGLAPEHTGRTHTRTKKTTNRDVGFIAELTKHPDDTHKLHKQQQCKPFPKPHSQMKKKKKRRAARRNAENISAPR